jgi:hypothetical protein
MIFAAIERGGEARAAVVPSASAVALDPLTPCGVHSVQMFGWFDRCPQGTRSVNSVLCTDELALYDWFGRKMRQHYRVTHARGEYARNQGGVRVHVNSAEGFFGLFKRAVFGIHHHVSACPQGTPQGVKHLHRYAPEHQFRYNGRRHDAGERMTP